MTGFFLIALVSYLIGSIPSGYIAGRIAGMDIREFGSGNIGATNVTRALGKRFGYAVFLADFSKGFVAVEGSKFLAKSFGLSVDSDGFSQVVAGFFCVIGNAFPIWLHFRGGKGVATSAGVLFALMPLAALVVTIVWIVTFAITRYVSLASIVATAALPITVFIMIHIAVMTEWLLFYVSAALAALVIMRHRSNIARLVRGTEHRFRRSED